MRALLAAGLLGVFLATAGCGGAAGPLPRHGILFVYRGSAKPVRNDALLSTVEGGGDLYLWRPGAGPRGLSSSSLIEDEPAWSPNGKQVAFTSILCNDETECFAFQETFVANSDGSGGRQLTFSTSSELRTVNPSWSPDGSRIVVQREFDNYTKLAILAAAGGKLDVLRVEGFDPKWGRPGIAYLAGAGLYIGAAERRFAIRLLNPQTGRWRPFASPPVGYSVQSLAWSSRNELAALDTRLRPVNATRLVAVYSAAGRRLSQFGLPRRRLACGMTWSPDGRRLLLATIAPRGPVQPQLFTVDPDGTHWRRVPLRPGLTSCAVSWR